MWFASKLLGSGTAGVLIPELVRQGLDRLPLPGQGATLQRWQALCAVAEHDLSLAKLYEGHTDALAVMAEVAKALLTVNCTVATPVKAAAGVKVSR